MKNKPKKTQKSYLYIIFLALAFIILLGTYAYPNKYGVPCDFVTVSSFMENEFIFESSETINFTLDDGATEEVPLYLAYPIAGTSITQQN